MESSDRPSAGLFRLSALAALASSFAMRICDPMLPALSLEFAVGLPVVAPVIGFFAIAYGLMQLVYGPLGERYGLFKVASWATVLAGLASLVCAASARLDLLILGRVLTGGAAAGIVPLIFAWIGERVPYAERQISITRVVSGVTLGVVGGQALGGIMVDSVGWRWAFALQAAMFLIPGAVMLRHLRTATATLAAGGARPSPSPRPLSFASAWQGYAAVLATPWVRRIVATVALEGLLFFGVLALLPSALHEWFQIPLWHAGLVSALFGLGGFIYTGIAPRLLAALGERKLVRLGWLGNSLGLLALISAPTWWLAAIICLSLGVCFYCQHNTLQTHGTQMAPERRGTAMACFASVYFAGQAAGVVIASAAITRIGFSTHFALIAVALAVLGMSLELALKHRGELHALGRTTGER